MQAFYDKMSALLSTILSWATSLTNFMTHDLLLSFIFAFLIFRMLLSFYKKIKHIF